MFPTLIHACHYSSWVCMVAVMEHYGNCSMSGISTIYRQAVKNRNKIILQADYNWKLGQMWPPGLEFDMSAQKSPQDQKILLCHFICSAEIKVQYLYNATALLIHVKWF